MAFDWEVRRLARILAQCGIMVAHCEHTERMAHPMAALTLSVPDSAFPALRRSPSEFAREMKLAAAVHWYQRGVLSQERAAELAGLNRRDFLRALVLEGVEVFTIDDESLGREIGG